MNSQDLFDVEEWRVPPQKKFQFTKPNSVEGHPGWMKLYHELMALPKSERDAICEELRTKFLDGK